MSGARQSRLITKAEILFRGAALLGLGLLGSEAFAQPPSPFTSGVWCGNVTATTASVVVRLAAAGTPVRLQVSRDETLAAPVFSAAVVATAAVGNAVKLSVQGLQSDIDYFYGIEVAGVVSAEPRSRGRFHTFPVGAASFRLAFASCGDFHAADQSAFDAIAAEHPLLFIDTGDLYYSEINSTNVDDYRDNYDSVLNQPNESALFRSLALAYVWDDHDYCGNNTDRTAVGRGTALAAFKERVPHYPLSADAGATVAQAFTIGRVRVIMTDLRSAADPANQPESPAKTRLGIAQKAWFKQELVSARDGGFPLILWISTTPWINRAGADDDAWGSWATEREELANFFRDNRIANLVLLAGDMHALAYDNGTNSDYATGGGAPLPVLQAAALTAPGEAKDGRYTGGPLLGSQQYGILEVYDTGGPTIACRFLGMKVGQGPKLSYTFSTTSASGNGADPGTIVSASASPAGQLANVSARTQVGSGTSGLIEGFVVTGPQGGPKQVLVRGVGPALQEFGVTGVLGQPVLSVFDAMGRLVATNRGWSNTANVAALEAATASVGAFALPKDSADTALLLGLTPGAYTLQVVGAGQSAGIALGEMYLLAQKNAQVVNLSCRASAGTGSGVLITGFVIAGGPATVLVRAAGPTLAQYAVTNPLRQPVLELFDSFGSSVASNTGWSTNARARQIAAAAAVVGAFPLAPTSADSALLLTLPPGAYTIQISGVDGTTGTALAESYLVP